MTRGTWGFMLPCGTHKSTCPLHDTATTYTVAMITVSCTSNIRQQPLHFKTFSTGTLLLFKDTQVAYFPHFNRKEAICPINFSLNNVSEPIVLFVRINTTMEKLSPFVHQPTQMVASSVIKGIYDFSLRQFDISGIRMV